jgi:type IV secretory pathway VirB10-like protein
MLFHVLVVALGLISWPFLQDKDTNAQPLIIVDVVATLPKTNLADSSAAKSSPEPEQEATRKKPPPPPPPPRRRRLNLKWPQKRRQQSQHRPNPS